MNALGVEEFMKSQKAKITEEKIRLTNTGVGILPSDSIALERSDRLRKERQSEYQAYIKSRDHNKMTITELRRELSCDREAELGQRKDKLDSSNTRLEESNDDDHYAVLQAKKLTEERQYRGGPHCLSKPRKHEGAGKELDGDRNKLACKISDDRQYQKSTWDEEERDLMQWTRKKCHSFKPQSGKENASPGFDLTRANEANSRVMVRSVSPIATTAMPLPGWNGNNDSHVQKMKKMKYAEDLRNQMREKQASVKYNGAEDGAADQYLPYGHLSRAKADRNMANDSSKALPCHKDYRDREYEWVRKPASITRSRDDNSKHDYPFYNLPPPSFQGYPGMPWIPPVYPYPTYYDHESYPEIYRHPYYYPPPPHSYPSSQNHPPPPGAVNPYGIPPSRHYHESRKHLPLREPSRGEVNRDLIDHDKRSYLPLSPLRQENNEQGGSPWSRDKVRYQENKDPKIKYREELEKQMREKKEREKKENIAKESLDKKSEIKLYDPFGKGGCGAPVRDQHGNLVADLYQMRKINESRILNNSLKLENSAKGESSDISESSPPQKTSHMILTYDKRNDEDVRKSTQVHYSDFLRQQVKEKEELKMKEKERQRIEDEKELEHLERDRKRIREEYQREQDLQKIKAEQTREKNEAIVLEAERKRQRFVMQQEREAVQEKQEQSSFTEKELTEKLSYPQADLVHAPFQSTSPPVPTLRRRMKAVHAVSTPNSQPQNYSTSKLSGNLSYQPTSTRRLLKPSSPDPTERNVDRSSPPVPTLRKKITNLSNTEPESSKANYSANLRLNPHASNVVASTQICGNSSQVLDATRITNAGVGRNRSTQQCVNSQFQGRTLDVNHEPIRSHHSNGANAVCDVESLSSRRQLTALDSEEILTKLGAIRMHLQEELARQNYESLSQPDIFVRAKQHEPRIAAPLKSKYGVAMQPVEDFNKFRDSSSTKQGEFVEMNPKIPRFESTLVEQQGALLRHQQDLRRKAQINIEKQRGNTNQKDSVDKDSYRSREGSNLPPEISPRSNPLSNNNDSLSLTRTHDEASQPGDFFSHISQCRVDPDTSGSSIAARNEERIKRLEAILNSGTYSKPPPLVARGYSSGSLDRDRKGGDRRLAPIQRTSSSAIQRYPSRQSERSLECETRHLPT